ncbi:ABC-type bacteriocin/lantibiotic exporters, containing an N-terminal double-glycine peptidase domain [Nostoc flagelliforme CCNUN1]|uniref:ABC-type bacteriocin/lantibiotic exporters, containing an N-terminal double-glycine peptidase domain n=1 Tax=Nostoc flagelliforme CCNUN1 TaxID=2038116 RepID=A0A2K8SXK9_9NOSO|nr:peptidase domain-containing ABC transporter [Nostoc flagelliforme]AUB40083.1 ABC-type bacteriocin/lantibiotic exporters, containing an N-terminal double-glycine peptidase domain [Nostoc flagelliforme CCNUN1]
MKYHSVLQNSEEDCGAACLATIAKHYGRTFAISRMREVVGTGSRGTSLLGLRRGAETLGFNTRQVKASVQLLDELHKAPLPAIIHWKGYHWVVLYGQKGKKYVIADPGVGIRYLTREELLEGWGNGIMLLLTPDESRFYQQSDDKIGGFGRYLMRVLPYRAILIQAIAINIVIGLLSLVSPLMMQLLTDDVLVRGDTQLLTVVAIGAIAMSLFSSAIGLVQSHLIGHFGQRLQLGLILEYGRQLLRLPLSYFEGRRSGEVVSRIADVNHINELVSQIVLGLPSQFFIALVSLGFMLFYSWGLTLASLAAFIIVTLVNLLFLPALRQKTRNAIVLGTENQGFLVETFRGVQVLKTTLATPQAWQEYQANYGRLANLGWSMMKLGLYSGTITNIISTFTSIALLWLGSYLVINRTLSIGQLLAFTGMSGNFLGFLGSVIGLVDEFITAQIVIQRLTEVIDATPEDDKDEKKPWAELKGNIDITCTNLNFHHAGRVDLLQDFSLIIPGGQVVALIGKSGCGKSTLAKLLAGLYVLQSGNIRYGIYNQQDLSMECLRQQVVLVPQEPHFWSRSILENFRFSYPQIGFEQIVQACEIAGADEFISKLPDKYQTVLGEFGANLSGGQRQRLAIARAIVTDPPILILDESTGALDPVSEAQLLDRLLSHRLGKTTIMISHRPKVIGRADWIVLLEEGRLKIQGTPEALRHQAGEHLDFLDSVEPFTNGLVPKSSNSNGKFSTIIN